jgi:hypothetical protein
VTDAQRTTQILDVLDEAFADLAAADPVAFRRKYRKMAADPFAFYRGSACLFYADAAQRDDPWATSGPAGCGSRATCTPRTSAPTWTAPACWCST